VWSYVQRPCKAVGLSASYNVAIIMFPWSTYQTQTQTTQQPARRLLGAASCDISGDRKRPRSDCTVVLLDNVTRWGISLTRGVCHNV